ncbi:MAG: aspartate 1-decarboxylase [Planctomycetota bacterium]
MMREMFIGKLHGGTITDARLDYRGSITIDADLLDRAGILVHQRVQVLDVANGHRFETYTIPGRRGGREIVINGAAARLAQKGDAVIIIAYALLDDAELAAHRPRVVILGPDNTVSEELRPDGMPPSA